MKWIPTQNVVPNEVLIHKWRSHKDLPRQSEMKRLSSPHGQVYIQIQRKPNPNIKDVPHSTGRNHPTIRMETQKTLTSQSNLKQIKQKTENKTKLGASQCQSLQGSYNQHINTVCIYYMLYTLYTHTLYIHTYIYIEYRYILYGIAI